MKIHEYQARKILSDGGIPVPSAEVIFTPDQGTDAHVRSALRKAGYPMSIVNTIAFPASLLNLGLVVNGADLKRAVELLHAEFFAELDKAVFD